MEPIKEGGYLAALAALTATTPTDARQMQSNVRDSVLFRSPKGEAELAVAAGLASSLRAGSIPVWSNMGQ